MPAAHLIAPRRLGACRPPARARRSVPCDAPAPVLPSRPDARAVLRRLALPAGVVVAVVVAAVALGGPAHTFLDALERAVSADWRWVAAGALFEALSFAGYVALLGHVAGRGTPRFG